MRLVACAAIVAIVATVLAGCGGSPTTPSNAPVQLTIMPLPTLVGNPNTGAFTAMLRNVTANPVELTFPTSCQLLPYFIDRRTGQTVTPIGGGVACATVITHLTVTPSVSAAQVFTVKGGTAPEPNVLVLPPGDYAIYARLEDQTYKVKSQELTFTLR
jgi:hypothetical protein